MKVICPSCKKEILESEYNLNTQFAQCIPCRSFFKFDIKQALQSDKTYKNVPKPDNIEISTFPNGGQMIIHHKSLRTLLPGLIIGVLFILIFFFFIIPSYSHNLGFHLFLPLLIPLYVVYLGLNEYLKKTSVLIENEKLSIITKSPISIKNTSWKSAGSDIAQIFVKKRIVESENSTSTYYDLGIETKNGHIHFPIKNFRKKQELYFIEVELEKLFDIEDIQHDQEMANLSIIPQNMDELKTLAKELYRSSKEGK